MVRAPCCDKVGLKKGPWTPEEDRILTDYIHSYGHANWRALPKQAGLLRCGKSCRLRWINYLKPDIKRGNFSKEEEEAIIHLHQMLGNRWSVIAARLPGRTDNEIKNVWHTHLKKRVINQSDHAGSKVEYTTAAVPLNQISPESPVQSCSDVSGSGTTGTSVVTVRSDGVGMDSLQDICDIDDSFWWEALSKDVTSSIEDYASMVDPFAGSLSGPFGSNYTDDLSFWLSVFNEDRDAKLLAEN